MLPIPGSFQSRAREPGGKGGNCPSNFLAITRHIILPPPPQEKNHYRAPASSTCWLWSVALTPQYEFCVALCSTWFPVLIKIFLRSFVLLNLDSNIFLITQFFFTFPGSSRFNSCSSFCASYGHGVLFIVSASWCLPVAWGLAAW